MNIGWPKDWSGLLNFLNSVDKSPIWEVAFFVALIFMLLKSYAISALDLKGFYTSSEWIFYCVFVVSSVVLLRKFCLYIWKFYEEAKLKREGKLRKQEYETAVLLEIESLNSDEKEILTWAVSNNSKTIPGPIGHHAYVSLTSKEILEIPQKLCMNLTEVPFTIKNFVWEKIKDDARFKDKNGNNR